MTGRFHSRLTFWGATAVALALLAAPVRGLGSPSRAIRDKVALYASAGSALIRYDIDPVHATLAKRESVAVSNVANAPAIDGVRS